MRSFQCGRIIAGRPMSIAALLLLWLATCLTQRASCQQQQQQQRFKCCELGELLFRDNDTASLNCSASSDYSPVVGRRLVTRLATNFKDEESFGSWPPCSNESEYPIATRLLLLEDDNYTRSEEEGNASRIACLDELYLPASNEIVVVSVRCSNRTDDSSTEDRIDDSVDPSSSSSEDAPKKSLEIRKCCPDGQYYDYESKYCVDDDDAGDELSRLLFNRSSSLDYFYAAYEKPLCEGALVDYRFDSTSALLYDGANFKIKVPRVDRNASEDVVYLGNNPDVCIDVRGNGDDDEEIEGRGYARLVARLCRSTDYCRHRQCFRKCCGSEDAIYDGTCDSTGPRHFQQFREQLHRLLGNLSYDTSSYGLLMMPKCEYGGYFGELETLHRMKPDGRLEFERDDGDPIVFDWRSYCVELIRDQQPVLNLADGLQVAFCFDRDTVLQGYDPLGFRMAYIGYLLGVSAFFLLLTLLVYAALPMLHGNIHGRVIMAYVFTLFVMYCLLGFSKFPQYAVDDKTEEAIREYYCQALAFTMYYFVISGFLWMNVTCFDIWWTFGSLKNSEAGLTASMKNRRRRTRLLLYCLYGWGLPLLFTGTLAACVYGDLEPISSRNSVGKSRCWFSRYSWDEKYFYWLPCSFTILLNVYFFLTTTYRYNKVKADIQSAMSDVREKRTRKLNSARVKLLMNFKLFVIMGVLFCMEMVSDFLENIPELAYDTWFRYALLLTDTLNGLQGLWVFCLFVLKSKVLRALATRLGCGRAVATRRRRGPNGARGRVNTAYFSRTTSTSLAATSSSNGQNGGSGLVRSTIDGVLRRFSSASSLNSAMSVTGTSLKP
ncbi:hypothetical protein TKK_0014982 [Trichogramma kaykai]